MWDGEIRLAFFVPKISLSNVHNLIVPLVTGGPYNHVGVLTGKPDAGNKNMIDAWFDGVQKINMVKRLRSGGFSRVDIFKYTGSRYAYPFNFNEFNFAHQQVGKPYDWIGIAEIAIITYKKFTGKPYTYYDADLTNAWYCSELAHAHLIHIGLDEKPVPVSPNGLAVKDYLVREASIGVDGTYINFNGHNAYNAS